MEQADVFFVLMGAILVFFMHAGFAFLEVGTVRHKNQVNGLMKILIDFSASAVAYMFVGYFVAYGISFLASAEVLTGSVGELYSLAGLDLVKFFFYLTFAAAIPAIISGGIAERMKFWPQIIAATVIAAFFYPLFEGLVWGRLPYFQDFLTASFGAPFHDFAGSVVVHGVGGFMALSAVYLLGARLGRYNSEGKPVAILPSSIPFLALGSWILCVGWFGFNVMSAGSVDGISGLVAMNSLMAMVGGVLGRLLVMCRDPGYTHNAALAGLIAVCAGSDVMHPLAALVVGMVAGNIFVWFFEMSYKKWRIDDVLGVWALHGICGLWGGIAAGIFGYKALGGLGGVSFMSQLIGSVVGVAYAAVAGFAVYGVLKAVVGIRLSKEEEHQGADISIHNVSANPADARFDF